MEVGHGAQLRALPSEIAVDLSRALLPPAVNPLRKWLVRVTCAFVVTYAGKCWRQLLQRPEALGVSRRGAYSTARCFSRHPGATFRLVNLCLLHQSPRAHFYPQHWLLCHLGSY